MEFANQVKLNPCKSGFLFCISELFCIFAYRFNKPLKNTKMIKELLKLIISLIVILCTGISFRFLEKYNPILGYISLAVFVVYIVFQYWELFSRMKDNNDTKHP